LESAIHCAPDLAEKILKEMEVKTIAILKSEIKEVEANLEYWITEARKARDDRLLAERVITKHELWDEVEGKR